MFILVGEGKKSMDECRRHPLSSECEQLAEKERAAGREISTELLLGANLGCWERFFGTKPALGLCSSELLPEVGNRQDSYETHLIPDASHSFPT